ncbi:glycosyltransferase family 4 protein [bacterium]|nr:glycosyltransferase family 4 protein [bacterium]
MKLLMITRKVDKDDGLAGFTYNWITKLSVHLESLFVICLEKGNTDGLPENIKVYSLGKENGKNRWKEFWRFHKLARAIVPQVDGVFAHQNPEYGILISLWTKIYSKKLIAWYAHGSVSFRLKLLNALVDQAVTSTPKGFRLKSKKLKVLHQGIDTDIFAFKEKESHDELRLLTVSRISKTKNIELMVDAVRSIKERSNKKIVLKIAGDANLDKDKKYLDRLKRKVAERGLDSNVQFLGSVANDQTPELYQWADIFLNFSNTGSMDKTVLEAMSCGTVILTSNVAFKELLNQIAPKLYLGTWHSIDKTIESLSRVEDDLPNELRDYVKNNHDLDKLMAKIANLFE